MPNPTDNEQRDAQFKKFLDALIGVQIIEKETGKIAEQNQEDVNYDIEHQALTLSIRKTKKERREQWDRILLILVMAGFVLSYLMIILIGFNVMTFNNSAFAVPTVVGAGILQTYGLAKIAAQHFFSNDTEQAARIRYKRQAARGNGVQ